MFLYWFWWVLAGGAEGEGDFGGQSFVQIGVFLLLIVFVFFLPRGSKGRTWRRRRRRPPENSQRVCACLPSTIAPFASCSWRRCFAGASTNVSSWLVSRVV